MTKIGNVYSFLAQVTQGLLTKVQLASLQAETNTLNLWTNSNAALTDTQVSNPLLKYDPSQNKWTPVDPNADQAIWDLCGMVNKVQQDSPHSQQSQEDMWNLVQQVSSRDSRYTNELSEAFMATLFSLAGQAAWNDPTSTNSQVMAALNATNSFLSSKAQAEEQPGSTEARAESSQLQTTSGVPSTLRDLASAFGEPYSNIAQLLGQSFV